MTTVLILIIATLCVVSIYVYVLLKAAKRKISAYEKEIEHLKIINQTITKNDDQIRESFKSISNDILQKNIDAFFKIANNTFENAEKSYKK